MLLFDAMESYLADGMLGDPAYAGPADRYLALLKQWPIDNTNGTSLGVYEPTAGEWDTYARKQVLITELGDAAAGIKASTADIVFPVAGAGADVWIKFWAFVSASSAGDAIIRGPLARNLLNCWVRGADDYIYLGPSHPFQNGEEIVICSDATIAGVDYNEDYYVVNREADRIQIQETYPAGSPVAITGTGRALIGYKEWIHVQQNSQPVIEAGNLILAMQ